MPSSYCFTDKILEFMINFLIDTETSSHEWGVIFKSHQNAATAVIYNIVAVVYTLDVK